MAVWVLFPTFAIVFHVKSVCIMKTERERRATRVTLYGAAVNIILVIFKLIAGFVGQSAAMIADGIHSLSDLLTDAVVIIFMRLSSRPQDEDHDYGHGKYETLATAIIGMALFVVGLGICYGGVVKIWAALQGNSLQQPGWIALVAALVSVALEGMVLPVHRPHGARHRERDGGGQRMASPQRRTVVGGHGDRHRWSHRPRTVVGSPRPHRCRHRQCADYHHGVEADGQRPRRAAREESAEGIETDIEHTVTEDPTLSDIHHLRTRRIGNHIAIEMHVRVPGEMTVSDAHQVVTKAERRLCDRFGAGTFISIHMEPRKEDEAGE